MIDLDTIYRGIRHMDQKFQFYCLMRKLIKISLTTILIFFVLIILLNKSNFFTSYAQDFSSEYITEIEYDYDKEKSNLDELVKVPGKNSLVLFYDSEAIKLNSESRRKFEKEMYIFEELSERYHEIAGFYIYDQAMEPSYTPRESNNSVGIRGKEVKNEGIGQITSMEMFIDGKKYDAREGVGKKDKEIGLHNCDIWITVNFKDEYKNLPTTYKFNNTVSLEEVPR